jgi:SAM-dependent methyltransferase
MKETPPAHTGSLASEILDCYALGFEERRLDASVGRLERIRTVEILHRPDASFDVVLMFGPLYHLIERRDRIQALAEAKPVLVPGGLLLSAYSSRFAAACDGVRTGALREAPFAQGVETDLSEGPGWFASDLDAWLDDPDSRDRLLNVLRQLEREASLIGARAHVLANSRRPEDG